MTNPQNDGPIAIIVHGGAWNIPEKLSNSSRNGVETAAQAGYQVLKCGGSALDAVETAVRSLENDPVFDAGTGSVLNERGEIEMDASIMSDKPQAGAVAGVSNIRNPVSLARKIMDSEHVFLVGKGAEEFAKEKEVETCDMHDLVPKHVWQEWEHYNKYGNVVSDLFNGNAEGNGHDTVGAVALDKHGNICCATSTGGITHKRRGRVGDSPIIGSGLYCEKGIAGCSTTGHGESILKVCLARTVVAMMEMQGLGAKEAAESGLMRMLEKTGGRGGLIMVDSNGGVAHAFSTQRMAWASVTADEVMKSGIDN